ncbi:unnamed protein product [Polarella glacialis]|uniref:Uncharacterized protein n=1 Tax=Polarella glacialis TaxID=89957 RepID=A0A813FTE0_POLGL|nr:unnamed protein product [Polarella glacialis]
MFKNHLGQRKRTKAWQQRSKIFLTRQKVAASLVQKAARDDNDQNKQTEQKEVDEEQEGIEAVCSIRVLSKATMRGMMRTNREGSELGHKAHDECYEQSRAGTAPPSPSLLWRNWRAAPRAGCQDIVAKEVKGTTRG